ncbi:MAG: DUF1292 domain-containing protein [Lachnospiraceae bacterium]|nr:DUF1292 domain-containing protein [Lachnospiraceae bacterium]
MSEEIKNNNEEELELETINLEYEDGTSDECLILDIFTVDALGDQQYVALLVLPEEEPADDEEVDSELMLYRYAETDEDVSLDVIEDENEYTLVEAAFQALIEADDEDEA